MRCHILSSDAPGAVAAVAANAGVDSAGGGLLRRDKLARVAAWQAAGRRVLMLGDG